MNQGLNEWPLRFATWGMCNVVQHVMHLLKIDKTFNGPNREYNMCVRYIFTIATVITTAASAPMGKKTKKNIIQYKMYMEDEGIIIVSLKHMLIRLNVECITDTEH